MRAESGAIVSRLDSSGNALTDASRLLKGFQVNLAAGANVVKVKVTFEDGNSTNTYAVTITRAASSDARLTSLTVSDADLRPAFNSDTLRYTANLDGSVDLFTIGYVLSNSEATMVLLGSSDGSKLTDSDDNTDGFQHSLRAGTTSTYLVSVTAEDGQTQKAYSVAITRGKALPNSVTVVAISNLLDITWTDSQTCASSYADFWSDNEDSDQIALSDNDSTDGDRITFGGNSPQVNAGGWISVRCGGASGRLVSRVQVASVPGTTSNAALLTRLSIDPGALSTDFDPANREYSATVSYPDADPAGKIGADPGFQHDLAVGETVVNVKASKGSYSQTYTIAITREPSEPEVNSVTAHFTGGTPTVSWTDTGTCESPTKYYGYLIVGSNATEISSVAADQTSMSKSYDTVQANGVEVWCGQRTSGRKIGQVDSATLTSFLTATTQKARPPTTVKAELTEDGEGHFLRVVWTDNDNCAAASDYRVYTKASSAANSAFALLGGVDHDAATVYHHRYATSLTEATDVGVWCGLTSANGRKLAHAKDPAVPYDAGTAETLSTDISKRTEQPVGGPFDVRFIFVSGVRAVAMECFEANDLVVLNGTASNVRPTGSAGLPGYGSVWYVTITPTTIGNPVTVHLPAGMVEVKDSDPVLLNKPSTVTVATGTDSTPPVAEFWVRGSQRVNGKPHAFSVHFNEIVAGTVEPSDFTVTNGQIVTGDTDYSFVEVSNGVYSGYFIPAVSADGDSVTVTLNASVVTDRANNANAAAGFSRSARLAVDAWLQDRTDGATGVQLSVQWRRSCGNEGHQAFVMRRVGSGNSASWSVLTDAGRVHYDTYATVHNLDSALTSVNVRVVCAQNSNQADDDTLGSNAELIGTATARRR